MNTKYWSWRLLIGSYCQSAATQFLVKILREGLIIELNLEVFERNRKCWYVQSSLTPRGPVCSFLLYFPSEFGLPHQVCNATAAYVQLLHAARYTICLHKCKCEYERENGVCDIAASVLIRKLLFSFCLHNGNNILNLPRTSSVSVPVSRFCHPSGASQKR